MNPISLIPIIVLFILNLISTIWTNRLFIRSLKMDEMENLNGRRKDDFLLSDNNNDLIQNNILQNRLFPSQLHDVLEGVVNYTIPFTSNNSTINHYFIDFDDIVIHMNSNDLIKLSIGLTKRQQKSFLSLNVNAFRKNFDD